MGALEAIKAAIVLVVGIVLGWLVVGLYAELVSLPAAREAGAQAERLVWQEAQRKAEAKAEADRRAAQVRIDAIERNFHQREAERLAQLSALEAAIDQEDARVPIPSAADRGAVACRPAVPRGLRDALDSVGRAAPRNDPAGSPAAVR